MVFFFFFNGLKRVILAIATSMRKYGGDISLSIGSNYVL